MIRTVQLLVILLVIAGTASVGGSQPFGPADAVETFGQGSINWTSGEVYATGIGAPPPKAVNPAQARAMAARAAQVVAYRNLLELVKGVRVDSETVVENFMTKSDIIRTRVDGIVKGARIVKTQYLSDGAVEVLVAMPLAGALMDAVVPDSFGAGPSSIPPPPIPQVYKIPQAADSKKAGTQQLPPVVQAPTFPEKRPEPKKEFPKVQVPQPAPQEKKPEFPKADPAPPVFPPATAEQPSTQFKGGKATGIIIDGRGLGLRPALLPKIVDAQGQEIYVGQVVTRTNAVEQGVAGYAKDVNAAANNFRVTDNPAVIKGIKAGGTARTDIVLSQADAGMLRDLSKRGDFLQYCRVIIVY